MRLDIQVTRTDHLADFDKIVAEEGGRSMLFAMDMLKQAAGGNVRPDTGRYGQTLDVRIEQPTPLTIVGVTFSPLPYAGALEEGRKPGRGVPIAVARAVVAKRLGLSNPRDIARAAYFWNKKVRERGLPAQKPLERALIQNADFLRDVFEVKLAQAIAGRL